jgi:hypothetical protein
MDTTETKPLPARDVVGIPPITAHFPIGVVVWLAGEQ